MNDLSVIKRSRRRRYSPEFKARIVAQCLESGASVSRIALDNGLNANMVRRWIREAHRTPKSLATTPGFVPVNLAAATSVPALPAASDKRSLIRISFPESAVQWWWSGRWSRLISVLHCCGSCWDDPH